MFVGGDSFSPTCYSVHGKLVFFISFYCKKDFIPQVNLLTTVLNDAPILPEEDEEDTMSLLKDSPQCVAFGLFMIWSV